jgi:protein-disulfide isomerase
MSSSSTGSGTDATVPEEPMTGAEAAEALRREVALRDRKRGRIAVWSAFGGVALIALGVVGAGYWVSHDKPSYVVPKHVAKHTDGIIAGGSGPIRVDVYVDYQCGDCKAFETAAAATLNQEVAANRITLVYHPLALNDAASDTQYSTRAAASAACASDLGAFMAYSNLLFTDEPLATPAAPPVAKAPAKPTVKPAPKSKSHHRTPKSHAKPTPKPATKPTAPAVPPPSATSASTGLSDNQLVQVGGAAGIINPQFAECLRAGTYDKWVADQNATAVKAHITAPTVLVNGVSIAAGSTAPTLAELQAALR